MRYHFVLIPKGERGDVTAMNEWLKMQLKDGERVISMASQEHDVLLLVEIVQ